MSPASSSIFDVDFRVLGGWLGVRQVTFAIFFFSPVRLGVEERTVAWSTLGVTSESLRFAFPFFCLVVAFRESEEFLVRKGRKLYFRTSCRQG
jgi:hypothetical protein